MQVQHMQHARCTKSETSLHRENFYIDFSILLFFDMQMLLVFSLLIFNFFFVLATIFHICCKHILLFAESREP